MINPVSRRATSGAMPAFLAITLALTLVAVGGSARAAPAAAPSNVIDGFASPPARATASSARLLSGGSLADGLYRAGVEIDLDPGTITYWRSPGEAGAPPAFDFSASDNVARVDVVYPAPKRIEEQGVNVAGYDSRVIFPLKITPRDPAAPATLKLSLHYSACGKICLPARAVLSLALPQTGLSPYAPAIADAERRVPQRLDPAQAKQSIAIEKAAADAWRLSWRGQGRAQEVFVEVADPLFVESVPAGDAFNLKLYASGAKPGAVAATLTIVTDSGAYEAPATLE